MRLAILLLLAVAVALAAWQGSAALAESWLTAFLAWQGIATGALGALAIGHLLREDWLDPVRLPLQAAARTLPLVALMAVPMLLVPQLLYPWADEVPPALPPARAAWLEPLAFRLRIPVLLALWIGLAWWLERPGMPKLRAALVLALLALSVPVAAQDLGASRDVLWWSSLRGFAVWVEGLGAALALAALVSLAGGHMPPGETGEAEALERALLALGLATLWLWFTQFIVVWMADLPVEAGWYLRRAEDGWLWLKFGVAIPALLLALVLAAPPRHRPWRLAAVCLLLLVSYLANLWWAVRPDAPLGDPPPWQDAAVLGGLGLAWAAWFRQRLRG